jgi:hypothetical protein
VTYAFPLLHPKATPMGQGLCSRFYNRDELFDFKEGQQPAKSGKEYLKRWKEIPELVAEIDQLAHQLRSAVN